MSSEDVKCLVGQKRARTGRAFRTIVPPDTKCESREEARKRFPGHVIRANYDYTRKKVMYYPCPKGRKIKRGPRSKDYFLARNDIQQGVNDILRHKVTDEDSQKLQQKRNQKMQLYFPESGLFYEIIVFPSPDVLTATQKQERDFFEKQHGEQSCIGVPNPELFPDVFPEITHKIDPEFNWDTSSFLTV